MVKSNSDDSLNWDDCPGTHLSFSPGDKYIVAEVQGLFFSTTEYRTLWAPCIAAEAETTVRLVFICLTLLSYFVLFTLDRLSTRCRPYPGPCKLVTLCAFEVSELKKPRINKVVAFICYCRSNKLCFKTYLYQVILADGLTQWRICLGKLAR